MTFFNSIFDNGTTVFALPQFLGGLGCALVLGIIIAAVYKVRNKTSQSFAITLALLPAVVAVVIMVVNGNIGAGVAVAGAFSLVRFRSTPGSGKEISMIFLGMGAGLMCGMGYLAYAAVYTLILLVALVVLTAVGFGKDTKSDLKVLRITIPESLNYNHVFDDLFAVYTTECEIKSVKSTNMGSMFKLTYQLKLKDEEYEKEFIDALRVRNGNLEIAISKQEMMTNEL